MRRIVHLVWHDVRSQQLPLLAFTLLLALEVAWVVSGYVLADRRMVVSWIPLVRALVTSVIAGLIIQRDPLVGTTAFWRTRPIGRGALLASKLLSLGVVLVLIPAVVLAGAWWGVGPLMTDALTIARVIAAEQAMVVLITAMAAVVTASLTHLVIAGVAGVALVTLANSVLFPAIMTTWPFVGLSLGGARPAWYLATLFALGLVAVAYQYFTLREWRTAGLVAVALVAAVVPPRFLAREVETDPVPVNRAVVNPDAVSLSVVPDSILAPSPSALANPMSGRLVDYSAAIAVEGLVEGVFLRPLRIDGRLTDRRESIRFTTRPGFVLIGAPGKDASWSSLQAALGESRLLTVPIPLNGGVHRLGIAQLERGAASRLAARPQTMTADVEVAAGRFRAAAAAPLRPGARLRVPGTSFEVLAIHPGAFNVAEVRIAAVERPALARFWMSALCLRNRERQEAVRVYQTSYRAGMGSALGMLGVRARHYATTLRLPSNERPNDGVDLLRLLDADWLAGAELVYLDVEELGTFTRPLRIEFTVPDTR